MHLALDWNCTYSAAPKLFSEPRLPAQERLMNNQNQYHFEERHERRHAESETALTNEADTAQHDALNTRRDCKKRAGENRERHENKELERRVLTIITQIRRNRLSVRTSSLSSKRSRTTKRIAISLRSPVIAGDPLRTVSDCTRLVKCCSVMQAERAQFNTTVPRTGKRETRTK